MTFKRALGRFDATMVVIGGIIGSGIFINPYIVAGRLDSTRSSSRRGQRAARSPWPAPSRMPNSARSSRVSAASMRTFATDFILSPAFSMAGRCWP